MTIITYTANTKAKLEITKSFLNSLPVKDWNLFTQTIETAGKDDLVSPEDFKTMLECDLQISQMTEQEQLDFVFNF